MNKINPQSVRDSFDAQLQELLRFQQAGMAAFTLDRDRSALTQHSLLAAAVAWEGFVSNLFIAYINVDASQFRQHLDNAFKTQIGANEKADLIFQSFGKLDIPTHLHKKQVQKLANRNANNITFSNFQLLEDRAGSWLSAADAQKFRNLSKPHKAVIDAVIALRNHVAHNSERSLETMNEALAKGALHTTGLKRGENSFHNVGAWLKAVPARQSLSRLEIVISLLAQIGRAC